MEKRETGCRKWRSMGVKIVWVRDGRSIIKAMVVGTALDPTHLKVVDVTKLCD